MSDGKPGDKWVTLPQFFRDDGYITLGHGLVR
jgi:hypothetical protein